jgi:alkylation response protein AidB-like acyl-CoA dehydrogenase
MELKEAVGRAKEVAAGVVAQNAVEIDREARWPREGIRSLLDAELGGLVVAPEFGGLGLGMRGLLRVCEQVGRECPSTALCFGMHAVATAVIGAKATADQRERYLEPIIAGKHLTTLALSEAGSGVHFHFPQTLIRPGTHDSYRLQGTKSFVTNGGYADSYVVSAVEEGADVELGRFSCLLVPSDAQGLKWKGVWAGLGMRGNASRELELSGVEVPRRNLLGEEGDQLWYVFHVISPYFLIAMTGTYLGIASGALEDALASVSERGYEHSGGQLGDSSVIQHRLGCLWSNVERTRRLAYHAAEDADYGGKEALPAVFSAKAEVADCAVSVVNEAMTLMGGRAYGQESRIHRRLRDARAAHVMAPTTDILRIWTGRFLLDKPLLD